MGLVRTNITVFVDLTEPDETADLASYRALIAQLAPAHARHCQYHRLAIPDMGIPTASALAGLLDTLDLALIKVAPHVPQAGYWTVSVRCMPAS